MNSKWTGATIAAFALMAGIGPVSAQTTERPAAPPASKARAKAAAAPELPAAIAEAFKKAYPNATIRSAAPETEGDKIVWEVESVDKGRSRDLVYGLDGTALEIEEQIDRADLPSAVTAGLLRLHPKATVVKAEKVTRGQTIEFELTLTGAAKSTAAFAPDGKPIPAELPKSRAAQGPYRLLTEIPVGGEGGWDYLSVDSAAKRLYVSHASKVVVIDTEKNEVVSEIAPTPGVHGFALAPDLGRGFSSNGQESKASIVDLKTLETISRVDTAANPDAILFEPQHKEVYTFNGRGKSATIFDAATGAIKATIPLPGKPEFAVADVEAGRIYNNIEDANALVVIDTSTHAVVNTWPIAPGEEASGLAIDLQNHRLFIGCSNDLMVMMDSRSGKVLGSVPIGSGVDANAFDPETGLVFASSSDGTLTVAKVDAQGNLAVVQKLATPLRSRTMTLDPATHRLYVSAAEFQPGPPGPDNRPSRPTMVPSSFKVLVYEMIR